MIAAHECFVAHVSPLLVYHHLRFQPAEDDLHVYHARWCVSNTLVQATLGVCSVNFWSFTVAWTRGGGTTMHSFDVPLGLSPPELLLWQI